MRKLVVGFMVACMFILSAVSIVSAERGNIGGIGVTNVAPGK